MGSRACQVVSDGARIACQVVSDGPVDVVLAVGHLPDARLVELEGGDHFPWCGTAEEVLAEVSKFLTVTRPSVPRMNRVATVLWATPGGVRPCP